MLAYAAHRRARRRLSPSTLALIIAGHAGVVALAMTIKIAVDDHRTKPIEVISIPLPKPPETPPPPQPQPVQQQTPQQSPPIAEVPPIIDTPTRPPEITTGPVSETPPNLGPIIETPLPKPIIIDPPVAKPVRIAARAITPSDLLRPPYPDSKRRSEEEAVLRLRLGIDERGRVTSVDPVGSADPAFLASARTHLQRYWRYKPAMEDGRAVATTMVITLRFELEDA